MAVKISKVLEDAVGRVEQEGFLVSGVSFARRSRAVLALVRSKQATQFCIFGAMSKHYAPVTVNRASSFLEREMPSVAAYGDVAFWNDMTMRTRSQVVAMLRRALAKAKAKGL